MVAREIKPFRSIDELLVILKNKDLIIQNEEFAKRTLKSIGYYRLSGYMLTLKLGSGNFYPGTTFEDVLQLYKFDTSLRLLILKYTECIEVVLRNAVAHYHSEKYSPTGYMDSRNFDNKYFHKEFLRKYEIEKNRSDDVFVEHHRMHYGAILPLWASVEVMSLSTVSIMMKNMILDDKKIICTDYFGNRFNYVENWMHTICISRNIAAHRGRLYNRPISFGVKLDSSYKGVDRNYIFSHIIAIKKLLCTNKQKTDLVTEFTELFDRYPFALPRYIGCPESWERLLIK